MKFGKRPVPVEKRRTHYQVLGVAPGATAKQLRNAYWKLAQELAPDKLLATSVAARNRHARCASGNNLVGCPVCKRTIEFAEVTCAYAVLKDAKWRSQYDAELKLRGGQCTVCGGKGTVRVVKGFSGKNVECKECGGTG